MLKRRAAASRGRTVIDWLDSRHTFSFGDYRDPAHAGFRALRVINEDRVAPGGGFGTHPHRDMEILTYVISGGLEHRDSMGNGSVIRAGDLQRMTAGTGVTHSERNHSATEPVHFLQIWIYPEARGLEPGYAQRGFDLDAARGELVTLASRDGRDGSLAIHQDAVLLASRLPAGGRITHTLAPGRAAWIQVVDGEVTACDTPLATGDGASIEDEREITIEARGDAEVMVFDLGKQAGPPS